MSQIPAVRERLERMFPHAEIHATVGRLLSADESIVAGLAETTVYDRVNLHRPSFDFKLRLPDGRQLPLYEAYSPLYDSWLAWQRNDLYFECVIPARDLPSAGKAHLLANSAMGRTVSFRFDGKDREGIEVSLGRKDIRFRIRPNGRISLTDGRNQAHQFRVDRWPVLRGKDHAVIQLEKLAQGARPRRARSWENDPLFLH